MGATSPVWRTVFVLRGLTYFLGAIVLFVFAESIATLPAAVRADNPWPWAIGPLALRFVAALDSLRRPLLCSLRGGRMVLLCAPPSR